ncbi:hypothetical protein DENSPDRAFT_819743 [Dentipellis sp. KUC8613]|nr:hypothetical protein DENSPDRAFT_819743 [Dentipellis sp. KUC8613]
MSFLRAITRAPRPRLYSSTALPSVCPVCHTPLPTRLPACPKCFHISPIDSSHNFYEILNVPSRPNPFVLNLPSLKASFRQAQRSVHPDVWAVHGQDKADIARNLSSKVNSAYNTLLSPLSRIQYILKQRGFAVGETDQLEDPELIEEIMEAREALEEAEAQSDVDVIREDNSKRISATIQDIEAAVASEDWETAKRGAVRLKYLQGIDDAAHAWPDPPFDH